MLRLAVLMFVLPAMCGAWHTPAHRAITKAALDTMPPGMAKAAIGGEIQHLIDTYSLLPDRFTEMQFFGFTRKSAGLKDLEEIRAYCRRPNGDLLHSAEWNRAEDLDSAVYLFERILTNLSEKKPHEAAMHLGVLAHFIEDSLSPPHCASGVELKALSPEEAEGLNLHARIEQSAPAFDLQRRQPRAIGGGIREFVTGFLDRLYDGAEQNRKDLATMLKLAYANDERALEAYRLRAAKSAAELLADTMFTLFAMAGAS